ncbi:hypothetical protein AVEN_83065-1 [Araneus ventricosus]|uniref:Uncharacterized protein n=1 Tax=Araneus ventricosus TaxID=182803 RepID=A0A4Y2AM86_ARAVE|nr:hypothetical protein AVEN_83065-1 [Araneus ventricosus]
MEAPCKRHNQSLRSPTTTVPNPPSALKTGHPFPLSRLPLLHFVVFAFVREPRSPSQRSYFSFMTQRTKWKMNEDENPNFSSDYAISHRIIALTTGFGAKRSYWLRIFSLGTLLKLGIHDKAKLCHLYKDRFLFTEAPKYAFRPPPTTPPAYQYYFLFCFETPFYIHTLLPATRRISDFTLNMN